MQASVAAQIFGQNKAPLDEVLGKDFAALGAEVADAVKKIGARPARVKDEIDFAAVGELVTATRKLTKRIEETRKDETDPLLEAQKSIKAHFDVWISSLADALSKHTAAADDYTRAKTAEERRRREEEAETLRRKAADEQAKAESGTGPAAARAEGRAEAMNAKADQIGAKANSSAADAVRTKTAGGGVATATTKWDFEITGYDDIDLNKLRSFLPRAAVETAIRSLVRIQKNHTDLPGVRVFPDTRAQFR